jgi:hypothetical protein
MRSDNTQKITAKIEKRPFSKLKRSNFVSLRGRFAAVAILKPKVWHPVAKHGDRKRQNPEFLIRRGAIPARRFPGSAISRGRRLAFPVRSIFHSAKGRFTAFDGSGLF